MKKEGKTDKVQFYNIFGYVWKKIPVLIIFIILLSAIEALLPAAQTLLIAGCIDSILLGKKGVTSNFPQLYLFVALLAMTQLCHITIPSINGLLTEMGKRKLDVFLKEDMVRKFGRLDFMYIEDDKNKEFLDRVMREPGEHFVSITLNMIGVVRLCVTIVSIFLVVASTSIISGVVIAVVCVPFYKIALRTGKDNYSLFREEEAVRRKYRYLLDVLLGREEAEERNLFGYTEAIRKKLEALYQKNFEIEKKIQNRTFINLKSGSIITLFLAILILLLLLLPFLNGKLTSGLLIALTTAVLNLVQTMSWELSESIFLLAAASEYSRDIYRFFSMWEKEGASDKPGERRGIDIKSIEFRHVTFRYPGTDTDVLKDCSFVLKKEHTYAFVGENGAGKSTIVKLLLGFYNQYTGDILINGKELKEYPYRDIKAAFSVMSQSFAKYSISIRENIRLGNMEEEDEGKILESIRNAGLEEKVNSLEKGIDTVLGFDERDAAELSLGQWQRLVLARMMYSNAPVCILDEPTAAIDPVQESNIYRLFQKMSNGNFTIVITHRLGAAKIADHILVISDGHVAEQGNHEALVEGRGRYYDMYQSQGSWYE